MSAATDKSTKTVLKKSSKKKKGKDGRVVDKTPPLTDKQAKALDLILQGVPKKQAMLEAGYSEKSSESPNKQLLSKAGPQAIIQAHRAEFIKQGITPQYLGAKMKSWLEAEKAVPTRDGLEMVPDVSNQLKAYRELKKDLGIEQKTVVQQNNTQINLGQFYDEFALPAEPLEGEVADGA